MLTAGCCADITPNPRSRHRRGDVVAGQWRTTPVNRLDQDGRRYLVSARGERQSVGAFFAGVGPDSTDEQIRAIAGRHPAFEVQPAP